MRNIRMLVCTRNPMSSFQSPLMKLLSLSLYYISGLFSSDLQFGTVACACLDTSRRRFIKKAPTVTLGRNLIKKRKKTPRWVPFRQKVLVHFKRIAFEINGGHDHLRKLLAPSGFVKKQKNHPNGWFFAFWWRQKGSNLRPHGCEPCALTNWAMPPSGRNDRI